MKDGKLPNAKGWGKENEQWWGKINSAIDGVHVEKKIETLPGDYMEFYDNVHDAIRNNAPLSVKPEESKEVIRLIEVCYESNKLRKAIKF